MENYVLGSGEFSCGILCGFSLTYSNHLQPYTIMSYLSISKFSKGVRPVDFIVRRCGQCVSWGLFSRRICSFRFCLEFGYRIRQMLKYSTIFHTPHASTKAKQMMTRKKHTRKNISILSSFRQPALEATWRYQTTTILGSKAEKS